MEEAEDKFEIANIARFSAVSATCLGHCLRVQPTPTVFEVVKCKLLCSTFFKFLNFYSAQDGKTGRISYDDPRAENFLQSIVNDLDNLKIVRKVFDLH